MTHDDTRKLANSMTLFTELEDSAFVTYSEAKLIASMAEALMLRLNHLNRTIDKCDCCESMKVLQYRSEKKWLDVLYDIKRAFEDGELEKEGKWYKVTFINV